MKVLILGYGYIGFQIATRYASSYDDVYIVDSEPDHNKNKWAAENLFEIYRRDIFNTKDLLKDADIIYNTVSVTSVPRTKEESTPEIDEKIYRIGTEGNRYVLEHMNKGSKLCLLSTHVVFEGYENIFSIDENTPVNPVLSYGKSKVQSEIDIKNAGINYLICRLASVYGHNMALRKNIVANILSMKAALDKKISISSPHRFKPLIGIGDVARAIVYLAEESYNKETFHLVNEHKRVGELAAICKEIVPELEINVDTTNTNSGYTLNNSKLLKTGFKFKENIREEIRKMIEWWGK